MSITAALAELERSAGLYEHIHHLQRVVKDEERRRKRFYDEIDEQTKAEFINGQIVVHSPARLDHLKTASNLGNLLGNFALFHQRGEVYTGKCLIRCQRNDYEPDVCFFLAAKVAGFDGKQSVFPPPDLIVAVLSPSTENHNRTLKRDDYAQHGVGEYWIVDADERMVEQHVLPPSATGYELKARLPAGTPLTSMMLDGFSVSTAAFFAAEKYQRALQSLHRPLR